MGVPAARCRVRDHRRHRDLRRRQSVEGEAAIRTRPGFHGSLVWGDGIFSNQAQLKAWLGLHGASYKEWVKQHPAALRLVKPPVKHKVAVTHKPRKAANQDRRTQDDERRRYRSSASAARDEPELDRIDLVIWLAVIAGLLFGLLALAAAPRAAPRGFPAECR